MEKFSNIQSQSQLVQIVDSLDNEQPWPTNNHQWKLKTQLDQSYLQFVNNNEEPAIHTSNHFKPHRPFDGVPFTKSISNMKMSKNKQRKRQLGQNLRQNYLVPLNPKKLSLSRSTNRSRIKKFGVSVQHYNYKTLSVLKQINTSLHITDFYKGNCSQKGKQNQQMKIMGEIANKLNNSKDRVRKQYWFKPNCEEKAPSRVLQMKEKMLQQTHQTDKKPFSIDFGATDSKTIHHSTYSHNNNSNSKQVQDCKKIYEIVPSKEQIITFSNLTNNPVLINPKFTHARVSSIEVQEGNLYGTEECNLCRIIGKRCSFH